MITDGLKKVLTLANHKTFIEMIGLKDQGKCLASIKLEENQQDILLLCKAKQNSKAFGYGANTSRYV